MTQVTLSSDAERPLRPLVEGALAEALRLEEAGLQRTEQRLREFEGRYGMTTAEFIERYERDELEDTPDFGEWVGEYRLLLRQREKADALHGIRIDGATLGEGARHE